MPSVRGSYLLGHKWSWTVSETVRCTWQQQTLVRLKRWLNAEPRPAVGIASPWNRTHLLHANAAISW